MPQRQLFPEAAEQSHYGTSVFHLYVHNWKCQLEFSPRFNDRWGLLDGEGLEHLWSYLSPLVSPLQYSTRSHTLGALQHKVEFHNKKGIVSLSTLSFFPLYSVEAKLKFGTGIVHWITHKHKMAIDRSDKAKEELDSLSKTQNPFSTDQLNYTREFFEEQWRDQQAFQQNHTNAQTEEQELLAEYLDQKATLENLRWLIEPCH